jgi:hypothetical protein
MTLREAQTKNLSVNNIYLQRHLPERDDRCCQVIQCHKTTLQLLIPHQQFSKAIEPAVRDFDHPSSGFLVWIVHKLNGLLPAPLDVRDVAMLLNDHQRGFTSVTRIGASMLAPAYRRLRLFDRDRLQHGSQLRNIMPIRPGHDDR